MAAVTACFVTTGQNIEQRTRIIASPSQASKNYNNKMYFKFSTLFFVLITKLLRTCLKSGRNKVSMKCYHSYKNDYVLSIIYLISTGRPILSSLSSRAVFCFIPYLRSSPGNSCPNVLPSARSKSISSRPDFRI